MLLKGKWIRRPGLGIKLAGVQKPGSNSAVFPEASFQLVCDLSSLVSWIK